MKSSVSKSDMEPVKGIEKDESRKERYGVL